MLGHSLSYSKTVTSVLIKAVLLLSRNGSFKHSGSMKMIEYKYALNSAFTFTSSSVAKYFMLCNLSA